MQTIPQIRKRLLEIAAALEMTDFDALSIELRELAEATKRRPYARKSKARTPTTDAKRKEVRDYAENFPDASYHELSQMLNVNTARISEILAGKREAA